MSKEKFILLYTFVDDSSETCETRSWIYEVRLRYHDAVSCLQSIGSSCACEYRDISSESIYDTVYALLLYEDDITCPDSEVYMLHLYSDIFICLYPASSTYRFEVEFRRSDTPIGYLTSFIYPYIGSILAQMCCS